MNDAAGSWAGVRVTNLDDLLFDDAGATKRDLLEYFEAVADRLIPVLADRPLTVLRTRPGQRPFVQHDVARSAPDWVHTTTRWAVSSGREITYAVGDDLRTLLWLGNQRAVELHPLLVRITGDGPSHLVLDIDPPPAAAFARAVEAAMTVRQALRDVGLGAAVKTSGAKGVHLCVPVSDATTSDEAAAATRAIAARAEALDPGRLTTAFLRDDRAGKVMIDASRVGAASVAAAYSPRVRPGAPVSFPVAWDELGDLDPAQLTMRRAVEELGDRDPWAEAMPEAQGLPPELVDEGQAIPAPRSAAMAEGRRRARGRATGRG